MFTKTITAAVFTAFLAVPAMAADDSNGIDHRYETMGTYNAAPAPAYQDREMYQQPERRMMMTPASAETRTERQINVDDRRGRR